MAKKDSAQNQWIQTPMSDDFKSVVRPLECDDVEAFERKLGQIAGTKGAVNETKRGG
jgi:hypothetical protein